ncbi:MAG: cytochrome c [Gammaproteobacteria bacterium]|jgi:mono/diheme cytochrome c family protein
MARERNWSVLLGAFGIGVVVAVLLFMSMAWAQTAAAERGREVYEHWCTPCHAPGPGHPGTQSLEIKYRGELPAVLEEREDMTPEFVRTMVRQGILMMAPFRKTEVTDAELDDLVMYLTH